MFWFCWTLLPTRFGLDVCKRSVLQLSHTVCAFGDKIIKSDLKSEVHFQNTELTLDDSFVRNSTPSFTFL